METVGGDPSHATSQPPFSEVLPCRMPLAIEAPSEVDEDKELEESSRVMRSWPLRRAFMKKLATVVGSRLSCCEIVSCISREGRFVSLKMACNSSNIML